MEDNVSPHSWRWYAFIVDGQIQFMLLNQMLCRAGKINGREHGTDYFASFSAKNNWNSCALTMPNPSAKCANCNVQSSSLTLQIKDKHIKLLLPCLVWSKFTGKWTEDSKVPTWRKQICTRKMHALLLLLQGFLSYAFCSQNILTIATDICCGLQM